MFLIEHIVLIQILYSCPILTLAKQNHIHGYDVLKRLIKNSQLTLKMFYPIFLSPKFNKVIFP